MGRGRFLLVVRETCVFAYMCVCFYVRLGRFIRSEILWIVMYLRECDCVKLRVSNFECEVDCVRW